MGVFLAGGRGWEGQGDKDIEEYKERMAGGRKQGLWLASGAGMPGHGKGKSPCGLGKSLPLFGPQFPQPQCEQLNVGLSKALLFLASHN